VLSNPSDRDLIARLARGDREALAPLVERHHRRLFRIAFGFLRNADDAEDAVQETFVKLIERAGSWDGRSEVAPWLTRILVNQSIDLYRKLHRRRARFTPMEDGRGVELPLVDAAPSPEARAHGVGLGERMRAALTALGERQRAVLVLRHAEGMSLEEIAAALDLRLGTVKSTLHRALVEMRRRLAEVRP
jgi:RNA polymerase sigma-70 factor, ECF subfamily